MVFSRAGFSLSGFDFQSVTPADRLKPVLPAVATFVGVSRKKFRLELPVHRSNRKAPAINPDNEDLLQLGVRRGIHDINREISVVHEGLSVSVLRPLEAGKT